MSIKEYQISILSQGIRIGHVDPEDAFPRIIIPQEKVLDIPERTWLEIAEMANYTKSRNFIVDLSDEQINEIKQKNILTNNYRPPIENAPESLKCLTTHAPFAYAIVMGKEDMEIRRKNTNHRGWTLIQAGLSMDSDEAFKEYNISPNVQRGCIIGAAELVDCRYSEPCYVYTFINPTFFKNFIPIKGKQCPLWGASSSVEKAAFTQAWNQIER
ncbi:hypothetical protein H6G80_24870 [Nostoc sp. FACHB-87]|uniref:hypothetical protein n=1 Tax=Nostocaceae TaxID=1162 RepID=UPI00168287B9|nr:MULTISPECIES: hypothetical protein [Nostocaceae]MBD2457296.1 hypothetical protein [Nostoc sp. FACHB-87]MBD2478365.1 hypothetical protein [Anabaena sp. FACHB-83]